MCHAAIHCFMFLHVSIEACELRQDVLKCVIMAPCWKVAQCLKVAPCWKVAQSRCWKVAPMETSGNNHSLFMVYADHLSVTEEISI